MRYPEIHNAHTRDRNAWGRIVVRNSRSSRGLEEACRENLAAIWLTGNLRPDHSTISDFRKLHPAALKSILREFNLVCFDLQLFGKELVAIDGTFIKAVNSRARSFTNAKLARLIEAIDKVSARYLDELAQADQRDAGIRSTASSTQDETAGLRHKLAKIKERKTLLTGYQELCGTSPTGQANLTDADVRQLTKHGKSTVGHNVQAAVDSKHHLIRTVEVTQEGNDKNLLDPIAQQAKADLGLPAGVPLQVLADSGYGTGPQHTACEAHGTHAIVPLPKTKSDTNGLYQADQVIHDPATDTHTCPQGQTLFRRADTKSRHEPAGFHTYHHAACRDCPVRGKCTTSTHRKLLVSIHQPAIERSRERLAAFPGAMRARAGLTEHPFGTIKDRHGHTGLLCREIGLAAVEMSLSAWAYNFTRVVNVLGIDVLLGAMRQRSAAQAA